MIDAGFGYLRLFDVVVWRAVLWCMTAPQFLVGAAWTTALLCARIQTEDGHSAPRVLLSRPHFPYAGLYCVHLLGMAGAGWALALGSTEAGMVEWVEVSCLTVAIQSGLLSGFYACAYLGTWQGHSLAMLFLHTVTFGKVSPAGPRADSVDGSSCEDMTTTKLLQWSVGYMSAWAVLLVIALGGALVFCYLVLEWIGRRVAAC